MSFHNRRRGELGVRALQEGLEQFAEESQSQPAEYDALQRTFGLHSGPTNLDELRTWFHTSFMNNPKSNHVRLRIRFAIQCIDHDDADFYDKNRWEYPNFLPQLVPDRNHWGEFIIAGLEDQDGEWRAKATKWLPDYAADADWAVERLIGLLNDPYVGVRWWAAMHLSRLAPRTPGVAETLHTDLHGESTVPIPEDFPAAPAISWLAANPGTCLPLLERNTQTWQGFPVIGVTAYRSYSDYYGARDAALVALAHVTAAASARSSNSPSSHEADFQAGAEE